MVYILESISVFSLVIDYEKIELISLALLWSEYSGLATVMSLALMSTVSLDQFSLLQGKFQHREKGTDTEGGLVRQPIVQLLKYQFLGSTGEETAFLSGADRIGPIRFFLYNLCSTVIWLSVIFTSGIILRIVLTYYLGRFGPVEFEVIVGILTVYIAGLTGLMILKKINPSTKK